MVREDWRQRDRERRRGDRRKQKKKERGQVKGEVEQEVKDEAKSKETGCRVHTSLWKLYLVLLVFPVSDARVIFPD